jgi:hypothetical protein
MMVYAKWRTGSASQSIYGSRLINGSRLVRWFYRLVGYDAAKSWRQSTYR